MGVLGFFFPLIGFILWALKKDTNPEDASKAAKGAWWGIAVYFILIILSALVGAARY